MSIYGLKTPDGDPLDPDLPDHLQAMPVATWLELVMRMKIPTKRKFVAFVLARFANTDGSSIRPGMKKVADMAGMDRRNLTPHIAALTELGMLVEKERGGGRGGDTNLYRLTRPVDITTLPLWLDPSYDRVPEGARFIPLAQEYRTPASDEYLSEEAECGMPASDETVEYGTPASHETSAEVTEHGTPASHESPVDNSGGPETGDVLSRNMGRSTQEYGMPASTDLSKTYPRPTSGLPRVGTSLGAKITDKPQAFAELVDDPQADAWTPEPPTPPRIVSASAGLTPAAGAHEAALAVLGSIPGGARFFAGRAVRQLTAEGIDPTPEAVAIRAAALVAGHNPESRAG